MPFKTLKEKQDYDHKRYAEQGEHLRAQMRANYWANRGKYREGQRKWVRENRDKHNAHGALRRASKKCATPKWLSAVQKQKILDWYTLAQATSLVVDHVIPLKGKTVCGLHVPWNLQLLTDFENASKHNKFIT